MRRAAISGLFFLTGLITTWAACWLGSRMNFKFAFVHQLPALKGCYELDHCRVPWWAIMLFFCYATGPSILFGIVGWKLSGTGRGSHTIVFAMLFMSIINFMFYLASYALSN